MNENLGSNLLTLVTTALNQKDFSGFSKMLGCVAGMTRSWGAILWNLDEKSSKIYVMAQWMQSKEMKVCIHSLPIKASLVGLAIADEKIMWSDDIWNDPKVYKDHGFLKEANINTMCVFPISYKNGNKGALGLYRNNEIFIEKDRNEIEQLCKLLPELEENILNKVGLRLLQDINESLYTNIRPSLLPTEDDVKSILNNICSKIQEAYQCIEVSVYLQDIFKEEEAYRRFATTKSLGFENNKIGENANHNILEWILKNGKHVHIYDLRHFDDVKNEYPGMNYDSANIIDIEHNILTINDMEYINGTLPLSFIGVPIKSKGEISGLIYCFISQKDAHYITKYELDILIQVAEQISSWYQWIQERKDEYETRAINILIDGIKHLNALIQNELTKEKPNKSLIFKECLKVVDDSIEEAENLDIRLHDKGTDELYFFETRGSDWELASKENIDQDPRLRRFSVLKEPPGSLGAKSFQTGVVLAIPDVTKEPLYCDNTLFKDIKYMIVSPICMANNKYGVLDIRGKGLRPPSKQSVSIAEIIGQQLGVYNYLLSSIAELRQARDDSKKISETQTQVYQDLAHQLKTPISQAHARSRNAVGSGILDLKTAQSIRSLCRRAERVTMNIGLFASLVKGENTQPALTRLTYRDLITLLNEAIDDYKYQIDPRRQINFRIIEDGFNALLTTEVMVDIYMLEQALNNVLDNAAKYSFSNTIVQISGGLTKSKHFHISIINKGLRILPEQLSHCIKKGWRSEEAKWTTGEGSGIGLWIVQNIMDIHRGHLEIVPTDSKNQTQVKLIYPSNKHP